MITFAPILAFVVGPLLLFCFIRFRWRLMPFGVLSLIVGCVGMGMLYVSLANVTDEAVERGDVPPGALFGFGLMGLAFLMTVLLGIVFVARRLSGDK